MDIEVIGNRLEAGLWLVIAAIIASHGVSRWFHHLAVPGYVRISALAFALFGVSDIVESFTGAWWTPWWLFAIKASCVLAFAYCFLTLRRAQAKRSKLPSETLKPTVHSVSTPP